MEIFKLCVSVFIVQFIFIYTRTWNVKAISSKNTFHVLISGAVIHIAWLFSIGISAYSVKEIVLDFEIKYIPVLVSSLIGGLIGSYIAMKNR